MKSNAIVLTTLIASFACTVLLVAGCSGGSTSSTSTSASGASSTSTSASGASSTSTSTSGASSSQPQSSSASSSTGSVAQSTTGAWPDNTNTADVPRPSFTSTPISVIDSGGITAITYSGISSDDSATYLQQLKDVGFTKVEADTNVAGTVSYVARNVNTKTHLSYSYTSSSGSLTVSLDRIGV